MNATNTLVRNNGHTLPDWAWAVRPRVIGSDIGSHIELPRQAVVSESLVDEPAAGPETREAEVQAPKDENSEPDESAEGSDDEHQAAADGELAEEDSADEAVESAKRRNWWLRTFAPTSDELAEQAREATKIRRLDTDPDVVAFRIEKTNKLVDRGVMTAVLFGMAFCAANVAAFALDLFKAHYAASEAYLVATGTGPLWWAAWLVDPAFSVLVMTILKAEQITSRYGVSTGRTVLGVGIFAFLATYVMNTWKAWEDVLASDGVKGWDGVVLHSVVPGLVLASVVVAPLLRKSLANCVERAYEQQMKRREREAAASRETTTTPRPSASATSTSTTAPKSSGKTKPKARKTLSPSQVRERNLQIARRAGARTAGQIKQALADAGVPAVSPSTLDNYAKALREN